MRQVYLIATISGFLFFGLYDNAYSCCSWDPGKALGDATGIKGGSFSVENISDELSHFEGSMREFIGHQLDNIRPHWQNTYGVLPNWLEDQLTDVAIDSIGIALAGNPYAGRFLESIYQSWEQGIIADKRAREQRAHFYSQLSDIIGKISDVMNNNTKNVAATSKDSDKIEAFLSGAGALYQNAIDAVSSVNSVEEAETILNNFSRDIYELYGRIMFQ